MNEREALAELVALQDMKDRLHKLHEMGHGTDYDVYLRRLPLAWDAARAALAQPAETEPGDTESRSGERIIDARASGDRVPRSDTAGVDRQHAGETQELSALPAPNVVPAQPAVPPPREPLTVSAQEKPHG